MRTKHSEDNIWEKKKNVWVNRGGEESSQIERKKKKKDQREREIQTDTEIWGKKTQQKKGEKKGVCRK